MMTRQPDILFTTEYIKNVLYFATVRQGKVLKSTPEIHYFSIDNELVYENYYSDFGPLNLGCVYKYCKILNEKLKQFLNKQTIVHYTTTDPKKKANAAFLLGCYGVLYLSLLPRDALKPLLLHGQSYRYVKKPILTLFSRMFKSLPHVLCCTIFRPFQDATPGDSSYTISILDCLYAIKKAYQLDFFNFHDFNYEEYERLDKIQGGDLNWIIPGKFLAFIGPVDYSVSLYHPPEMYIDYFKANNIKIVIRLNKRMYDGQVFNNAGIAHYDLFFPDGSCPPRHILLKFLQIAEESDGAIAVHCKAGLGRTGSLIGCYLIKHYRMTAHEAIGWMRICRPGSVIGHQQGWLEHLETWLIKQGNLYRKRTFQDPDKLPIHEFGVYSISEKMMKQRPVVLNKAPSQQVPIHRQTRSEIAPPVRPQASKVREAFNKAAEKEQHEWRLRTCKANNSTKITSRGSLSRRDSAEVVKPVSRRGSGAGDPRQESPRASARSSPSHTARAAPMKNREPMNDLVTYPPVPTFRTTQGPVIKTLSDAKDFLIRSSAYGQQREKNLRQTVTVTPHYTTRSPPFPDHNTGNSSMNSAYHNTGNTPVNTYSPAVRSPPSSATRRRRGLGRSPSPSPSPSPTRLMDHTRATNTLPMDKYNMMKESKSALRDALSRLKLTAPRDGSIGAASVGAASLGARREAPAAKRAPSVHSDERPLATQGDMLNSIKFQRRFRDTLNADKISSMFNEKVSIAAKEKSRVDTTARVNLTVPKLHKPEPTVPREFTVVKERNQTSTSKFLGPPRPTSPKGRQTSFY